MKRKLTLPHFSPDKKGKFSIGRLLSQMGKILLVGILVAVLLFVGLLALFQLALTFHLVVFS